MTVNVPPSGETAPPIYNGRYELHHQIARGGTAQVYLARDLLLERLVALKVLFPELSSDSSFVERFRREAQAAANLSHPNIVPVFDWGESDRTYFIVMEHVDGEPLSAIIHHQAPLPALRAAAIAADIAKALSYAHRHGVVHRDVKPGNVLITRDGQVKVADFGIARAVGSDESVTQTGLVMGTATYFSPEQAQGLGVDGRSDVYSLGVVLYEMVTGRPPFMADTPVAIAYKHVSEAPVPPRQIDPRIPAALEAIIMQAMAKNPAQRYATAEDLHADLQRFMQGAAVLAPSETGGLVTGALVGGAVAPATTAALQTPVGTSPTTVPLGAPAGAGGGATAALPAAGNGGGRGGGALAAMPKRRWMPWTVTGVVLMALIVPLVLYGAHRLGYLGSGGYFNLPPAGGQRLSGYMTTLRQDGLNPVARSETNKNPEFTVLGTVPPADHQVQKGQTVVVYYSRGPALVPVPNVVGDQVSAAEATLKGYGLKVVLHPVRATVGQATQVVLYTSPKPATPVSPGSAVTITYASGTPQTTVPRIPAGDSVAQAEAALERAYLVPGSQIPQLSGTVATGSVIATDPPAGTELSEGDTVQIVVSEGPGVAVPTNLKGEQYSLAEQQLTKLGLDPTVVFAPSSAANKNLVLSVSPTGQVAEGTTITLTVGQGPPDTVTVTNPGPQVATVGTPIAPLQITATDSLGLTLTYTAVNLPPGLTISPAGLVSGVPLHRGTFSVTVTAIDTSSISGSVTFTWTVYRGLGGP